MKSSAVKYDVVFYSMVGYNSISRMIKNIEEGAESYAKYQTNIRPEKLF